MHTHIPTHVYTHLHLHRSMHTHATSINISADLYTCVVAQVLQTCAHNGTTHMVSVHPHMYMVIGKHKSVPTLMPSWVSSIGARLGSTLRLLVQQRSSLRRGKSDVGILAVRGLGSNTVGPGVGAGLESEIGSGRGL